MSYIALKPCTFAGERFKVGDNVPQEVLQPGNVKNLVKMGVIAAGEGRAVQAAADHASTISIHMHTDKGDMELALTAEGLQAIFDVLAVKKADEAEPIIAKMTDDDALILLHMADTRKAVKAAVEARAKAISPAESEGDE